MSFLNFCLFEKVVTSLLLLKNNFLPHRTLGWWDFLSFHTLSILPHFLLVFCNSYSLSSAGKILFPSGFSFFFRIVIQFTHNQSWNHIFFLIGVRLLYNVVLVSAAQHLESAVAIYTYIPFLWSLRLLLGFSVFLWYFVAWVWYAYAQNFLDIFPAWCSASFLHMWFAVYH